jgi:type VI secretion system secreted protein Hcp
MHFYLKMKGSKSGAVKGSVTQKGREDTSLCTWYQAGFETPTDDLTGQFSGKRRHKALRIRKEIDKASPIIYQMGVNNEILTEVTLLFWRVGHSKVGGTGQETQYYTIKLTNAAIQSVQQYTPDHAAGEQGQQRSTWEYEEIAFTYQAIDVTWMEGGITAHDDWEAPVAG